MPLKIDVHTNFQDKELTIEACSEIINMLQHSYKSIKNEIYNQFFSLKNLRNELIFVGVLALLYYFSEDIFFIYLMPISVLITMIVGCISAEVLSNRIKKEITKQIEHFKQIKDNLMKEKIKA